MARACDMGPVPVNWRDVGVSLRLATQEEGVRRLPCGRLLRCGALEGTSADFGLWGEPRSIVNLRMQEDQLELPEHVSMFQVAAENSLEKYDTANPKVCAWVCDVLRTMENAETPVLLHCRSGKDRTGIVVAAVLVLLGYSDEAISSEFAKSAGVKADLLTQSLEGFRSRDTWCRGVNVQKLLDSLCCEWAPGEELAYLERRVKAQFEAAKKAVQDEEVKVMLCRELASTCSAILAQTGAASSRVWGCLGWLRETLGELRQAVQAYDEAMKAVEADEQMDNGRRGKELKMLSQRLERCKQQLLDAEQQEDGTEGPAMEGELYLKAGAGSQTLLSELHGQPLKLIFLDVDGVLNDNTTVVIMRDRLELLRAILQECSDAYVVLSSAWRSTNELRSAIWQELEQIRPGCMLGQTRQHISWENKVRPLEIADFLSIQEVAEAMQHPAAQWVAVDDMDLLDDANKLLKDPARQSPQSQDATSIANLRNLLEALKKNFVRTNGGRGLDEADAAKIKTILQG